MTETLSAAELAAVRSTLLTDWVTSAPVLDAAADLGAYGPSGMSVNALIWTGVRLEDFHPLQPRQGIRGLHGTTVARILFDMLRAMAYQPYPLTLGDGIGWGRLAIQEGLLGSGAPIEMLRSWGRVDPRLAVSGWTVAAVGITREQVQGWVQSGEATVDDVLVLAALGASTTTPVTVSG